MAFDKGLNITMELFGTPELLQMMGKLRGFIKSDRLRAIMEDAKNRLVGRSRTLVPRRSWTLWRRIDGKVEDFGSTNPKIRFGVKNLQGTKYPESIEFGAKPHAIVPRAGHRFLRWVRSPSGQKIIAPYGIKVSGENAEVFKRAVQHPGNPPQPFIRPSVERVRPLLILAVINAMKRETGGL